LGGLPAELLSLLPEPIAAALLGWSDAGGEPPQEIRMGARRPLLVVTPSGGVILDAAGRPVAPEAAYEVSQRDLVHVLQAATGGSVYAAEDEIRSGYITVRGGHRIGLAGTAVTDGGRIETLKHISSLSIRICRDVPGACREVLPLILQDGRPLSTLILSPPGAGKTTLLRDLARNLSYGVPDLGVRPYVVGIVDERSELAGTYRGIPQLDVGPRTDVLDACPKGVGIMMFIRAMSPEVIVTDEVGRPEDVGALREAVNCGVTVIASCHGRSVEEVRRRPMMRVLLSEGIFARLVCLSRRRGPGTLEAVMDATGRQLTPAWRDGSWSSSSWRA